MLVKDVLKVAWSSDEVEILIEQPNNCKFVFCGTVENAWLQLSQYYLTCKVVFIGSRGEDSLFIGCE